MTDAQPCPNCQTGIIDEEDGYCVFCDFCDWHEPPTKTEQWIFWTVIIGCPAAVIAGIAYLLVLR